MDFAGKRVRVLLKPNTLSAAQVAGCCLMEGRVTAVQQPTLVLAQVTCFRVHAGISSAPRENMLDPSAYMPYAHLAKATIHGDDIQDLHLLPELQPPLTGVVSAPAVPMAMPHALPGLMPSVPTAAPFPGMPPPVIPSALPFAAPLGMQTLSHQPSVLPNASAMLPAPPDLPTAFPTPFVANAEMSSSESKKKVKSKTSKASKKAHHKESETDPTEDSADSDEMADVKSKTKIKKNGRERAATAQSVESKKQQRPQKIQSRDTFQDDDVDEILAKDFDFQANLNLFDKQRIFKDIKGQDTTVPSTRLVALNVKSGSTALSPGKKGSRQYSDDERSMDKDLAGWRAPMSGVLVPSVTASEMREIEDRLDIEGIDHQTQMDTAGFSLAAFCLQIAGSRRLQPGNLRNNGCDMVLLVGNHRQGAVALAAGRHLVSRGVNVAALILKDSVVVGEPTHQRTGKNDQADLDLKRIMVTLNSRSLKTNVNQHDFVGLQSFVLRQLRLFFCAGGEYLQSVQDLPRPQVAPVDLIIDAMLDYQIASHLLPFLFSSTNSALSSSIQWANDNKAPVVSLDVPCGIDATTGRPLASMNSVTSPTLASSHHSLPPVAQGGNLLAVLFGNATQPPSSPLMDTSYRPSQQTATESPVIRPKYTVAVGLPKLGLLQLARNVSQEQVSPQKRGSNHSFDRPNFSLGDVYLLDSGLLSTVVKQVLDAGKPQQGQRRDDDGVVVVADDYIVPFADKIFINLQAI